MEDTKYIFIGNSHINALMAAANQHSVFSDRMSFVHLVRDANDNPLLWKDDKGAIHLNQSISSKLQSLIKENPDAVIVSLIGGNAHNMLSLLEHPEPFDFMLPGYCNKMTDKSFIPYQQLYDVMNEKSKIFFDIFDLIRAEVSCRIYHLESPPPIGSDSHIHKHLDPHFEKIKGDKVLSSKELRYKMWKLHSVTFIDYCKTNNVNFIPVPVSSYDSEGFLRQEAYPANATHGNSWYGKKVLEDLIEKTHEN